MLFIEIGGQKQKKSHVPGKHPMLRSNESINTYLNKNIPDKFQLSFQTLIYNSPMQVGFKTQMPYLREVKKMCDLER